MKEKLSVQMKRRTPAKAPLDNKGNFTSVISSGSTLLDLAISGGNIRGGGMPGGIMVEIFGPESSGKSALACEISGNIQKQGGQAVYDDPEGRIDSQYALMYGVHLDEGNYRQSDTITEVFKPVKEWKPEGNAIHGIIIDSLAALSTDMEMNEGDKLGARRAKEFSQELRQVCRIIKQRNYLMVCTNQIRDTFATIGAKHDSTGGKAIRFYSSLRLETGFVFKGSKITKTKKINNLSVSRIVGININVKVVKSSIWKPYYEAPVSIIFNYGIDDIRSNLQYLKDNTSASTYVLGGQKLAVSMDDAIKIIERDDLVTQLKEEVIDLWETIEIEGFKTERKPKQ